MEDRFKDVKVGDTVLTPERVKNKFFLLPRTVTRVYRGVFETSCNRVWKAKDGRSTAGTLTCFKEGQKYYGGTVARDQTKEYEQYKKQNND